MVRRGEPTDTDGQRLEPPLPVRGSSMADDKGQGEYPLPATLNV
ncbi:hypothetical protein SAMN05216275_11372 [Streptosporangium canum]|uniref:Uncharacterized protein n=1 Tax=Streptosporangium canum TaxID=324952 RepID=A0A1I3UVD6_9ACTN|nr:hypothetical protein SAMN05216275_11372 [Streptosporangium canum]